jgi:hypothetical protein
MSERFRVEEDIFECAVDPHILPNGLVWLTDGDHRPYVLSDGEWRFALCWDGSTYTDEEFMQIATLLWLYGWRGFKFQSLSFSPGYWDEVLAAGSENERLIVLLNPHIDPPGFIITDVRIESKDI